MNIPFSLNWIRSKCYSYILQTSFKKSNYKEIRQEIKNRCCFLFFSLPLKNIIILKNYYTKNNTIICIKPLFGNNVIVFEKKKYNTKVYTEKKNFNVFSNFKKKRKQNAKLQRISRDNHAISYQNKR